MANLKNPRSILSYWDPQNTLKKISSHSYLMPDYNMTTSKRPDTLLVLISVQIVHWSWAQTAIGNSTENETDCHKFASVR